MKNKSFITLMAIMAVVTVLFVACSSTPTATPTPTPTPTAKPSPSPTQAPSPSPTASPKPTATPSPTAALPPMPDVIRLASYGVGSMSYIQDAAVGEGMQKKFNIRLRAMPVGAAISRLNVLKQGTVDISNVADFFWAMEGTEDYAVYEWGPQQIRMAYQPNRSSSYGLVTSATSGIKKIADLKGKRVTYQVGSAISISMTRAALQYASLDWGDVKKIEVQSLTAAYRAVLENKADATLMSSTAGQVAEMDASPMGIYFIPEPTDDKAAWTRVVAAAPVAYPIQLTSGPGITGKQGSVWTQTFGFPNYAVYKSRDAGFVYWIVKAYVESLDFYKDATPEMIQFSLKNSMAKPMSFPYHDGAIRYFKEAGVWTPQMDKNQKELVDRMDKLEQTFKATVAEYMDKKMKEEEFKKFWLDKRAAAFPSYWMETPVK